jgi:hypothetical protein
MLRREREDLCYRAPPSQVFEGGLQTLDKSGWVKGLSQVANRPTRKRPGADLLIGECCEKNKWNTVTLSAYVILQLDATHSRHLDIRNYAREVVETFPTQELFGGRECLYDISDGPQQGVGRDTHGFLIVNDCDKG